jgi:hypothetical protein
MGKRPKNKVIRRFISLVDRLSTSSDGRDILDTDGYGSMDWQALEDHEALVKTLDWLKKIANYPTMTDTPVRTTNMLFILHNTEDGLRCRVLNNHQFDAWVTERTDGIKPEHHPKFVNTLPNETSPENEYLVIDGKMVIPQPVTTVTKYALD